MPSKNRCKMRTTRCIKIEQIVGEFRMQMSFLLVSLLSAKWRSWTQRKKNMKPKVMTANWMGKNRRICNVTNLVPNKITDEHPHEGGGAGRSGEKKVYFPFLSSAVATARNIQRLFFACSSQNVQCSHVYIRFSFFSGLFCALFRFFRGMKWIYRAWPWICLQLLLQHSGVHCADNRHCKSYCCKHKPKCSRTPRSPNHFCTIFGTTMV